MQPYDPKRSCWVPIKEGGFVEGSIEAAEGDKVTVKCGKDERKILKKDQVQQVNPPKFERCEDMSNLTYLNDASVLHNLKARYVAKLIYVSEGNLPKKSDLISSVVFFRPTPVSSAWRSTPISGSRFTPRPRSRCTSTRGGTRCRLTSTPLLTGPTKAC